VAVVTKAMFNYYGYMIATIVNTISFGKKAEATYTIRKLLSKVTGKYSLVCRRVVNRSRTFTLIHWLHDTNPDPYAPDGYRLGMGWYGDGWNYYLLS